MTNEEFIQSVTLDGEEWRDVTGWEGYYKVSSFGRVLSIGRTLNRKDGTPLPIKPRLLKLNIGKHNGILYAYICFRKRCERHHKAVHRLVAEAFLPNPNNYSDVDHIDRNGTNNHVENLRWCSRSMNMLNENTRIVTSAAQRRKILPTLRKPVVQITRDNTVTVYSSISEAHEVYGYSLKGIIDTCKGRIPTYKDQQWMYLSDYESLVNKSKNSLPTPNIASYPQ